MYDGRQLTVHFRLPLNTFLRHSFVPSDFCECIIAPLLKKYDNDKNMTMQFISYTYLGITLSPVLSKLFEMLLHSLFEDVQ